MSTRQDFQQRWCRIIAEHHTKSKLPSEPQPPSPSRADFTNFLTNVAVNARQLHSLGHCVRFQILNRSYGHPSSCGRSGATPGRCTDSGTPADAFDAQMLGDARQAHGCFEMQVCEVLILEQLNGGITSRSHSSIPLS